MKLRRYHDDQHFKFQNVKSCTREYRVIRIVEKVRCPQIDGERMKSSVILSDLCNESSVQTPRHLMQTA
jgi:hypothetical protein